MLKLNTIKIIVSILQKVILFYAEATYTELCLVCQQVKAPE